MWLREGGNFQWVRSSTILTKVETSLRLLSDFLSLEKKEKMKSQPQG